MDNLTFYTVAQMQAFATQKTFIKAFKINMGTTPDYFIKLSRAKYVPTDDQKLSMCLFVYI